MSESAPFLEIQNHAHVGKLNDVDQIGLGLPLRQHLGVERAGLQADVAGLDLREHLVKLLQVHRELGTVDDEVGLEQPRYGFLHGLLGVRERLFVGELSDRRSSGLDETRKAFDDLGVRHRIRERDRPGLLRHDANLAQRTETIRTLTMPSDVGDETDGLVE